LPMWCHSGDNMELLKGGAQGEKENLKKDGLCAPRKIVVATPGVKWRTITKPDEK